ncbi:MAG: preprotein translocase subunit SecE [Bdellovibrionales bacterium]
MKNDNSKIITLSFVAAAFIVAYVLSVLMEAMSASFGVVARLVSADLVRHGLPVATGLICFAALQFNKNIVAWADEVVTEISKVVWPSQKDTTSMTIVVCVMLILSGFVLGFFDFISNIAVDKMVNY